MPVQSVDWRSRNIGRLMLCAADAFVTDKLREIDDGGFGPVTQVHIALLQSLDLDGTRLTLLAERAQMTKQSMLELVDKAEALGLVERQPDPVDGRAKVVAFTLRGLQMMGRLRDGVAEAERRMAGATGAPFVPRMKRKLAGYIGENNARLAGGLAMSAGNDAWWMCNAGRVLALAFTIFSNDVLHVIRDGGFRSVSEVHMTLLRNIDLAGTRPTELAARARMTKQAMTDLVLRTEQLGLVVRVPDPNDGRAKMVVFTKIGLRLHEQVRIGVEQAEQRMAAAVGAGFLAEMKKRLAAYVASVETFAYLATDVGELARAEGLRQSGSGGQAAGDGVVGKQDYALGRAPRSSRMMRAG